MSPLRNIKLIIEYDGTGYSGWQFQLNAQSIQQVLETAFETLTHVKTRLYCSGRTDAGVHAIGQVANFRTESRMSPEAFVKGCKALLPADIVVKSAEEVPLDFNARFSATGKKYRYLIYNSPTPSALLRNYAWHVIKRLDLDAMQEAAGYLIGRHDFNAFRASSCDAPHAVRVVRSLDIMAASPDILPLSLNMPPIPAPPDGPRLISIEISADAFLKHMVRNITGTLAEVGKGRTSANKVKTVLDSLDRRAAGPTAPPHGLFLVSVNYDGARTDRADVDKVVY